MILIVDNYDSFVHNLARYAREAGEETYVVRSDAGRAADLLRCQPDAVIISPGPKGPADAGASKDVIRQLSPSVPLLGVCLGQQCLVEVFGGATVRSREPLHGSASLIRHDGAGVFAGVESPTRVGRYHSLISALADDGPLRACAWSEKGEVMAVRHETAPWHGVQFHPESLLTPAGRTMIGNFIGLIGRRAAA